MRDILKLICESGIFFWSILGFIFLIISILSMIGSCIDIIYNFAYKNINGIQDKINNSKNNK